MGDGKVRMDKIGKKTSNRKGLEAIRNLMIAFVVVTFVATLIIVIVTFASPIKVNKTTYKPSTTYSSSKKTDWNAYCRDIYPDSPSARKSCVDGAKAMENLMDGKYDK